MQFMCLSLMLTHFAQPSFSLCRNPGEDTKMLVCDMCDKGYHTFCLQPAMESLPTNGWRCKVGKTIYNPGWLIFMIIWIQVILAVMEKKILELCFDWSSKLLNLMPRLFPPGEPLKQNHNTKFPLCVDCNIQCKNSRYESLLRQRVKCLPPTRIWLVVCMKASGG